MSKNNTEKWGELFSNQSSVAKADIDPREPNRIDSYYFIFDCTNNKIEFVNSAFKTFTGYENSNFTIEKLLEIIHPHDLEYFYSCEAKDLEFTNRLSFDQHYQYFFKYSYRIVLADDSVATIEQQCQAIEVNDQGHLSKTLVIHKRIPEYESRPATDHKIFDRTRGMYIDSENCYGLSKRELEILTLIKKGLNSVEISEVLHISKYTIDTHRKNILNKTNSVNFIELLHKLSFSQF